MPIKRAGRTIIATGLVAGALVAVAYAAHPIKGATYAGSWGTTLTGNTVSFKVSTSGKKVSAFKLGGVPLGCQGVIPLAGSASAAVSKEGKFTAELALYFPPTMPHRHVGTLTVSGTFLSHRKERGKLTAKYTANGFGPSCSRTVNYSTTG